MSLSQHYIKKYKKENKLKCEVCGFHLENHNMDFIEVHHIIPLKHGGDNTFENFMLLCPTCHAILHNTCIYNKKRSYPKTRIGVIKVIQEILEDKGLTDEQILGDIL